MAAGFQLRIVTPRHAVVDQRVSEVTAPGRLGEFGVLPDHATFLTSLESGVLLFKDAHGPHTLAIRSGFAEVADNVMTVLCEAAEAPDEIDPAAARADLSAAETALATLTPVDPDYPIADAKRRWAQARLAVAK